MDLPKKIVKATTSLPDGYVAIGELDLSKDTRAALLLNLASLPLFAGFGWLFLKLAGLLRPGLTLRLFFGTGGLSFPLTIALTLAVPVFVVVIHEAIHGIFFWVFTRSRPTFGLKLLFAYAGAPAWYIPRAQYVIVGVAPFVVITAAGFLVLPCIALPIVKYVLFGMLMNAAGAVGDFYVAAWILSKPSDILINDTGVGFTLFGGKDLNREGEK